MRDLDRRQRSICDRYGAQFDPPSGDTPLGIALQTLSNVPINGLRHPPEKGTCGWYIWAGAELDEAPDFFQPLCLAHLGAHCSFVLPYLALPPGWRFQIDLAGYEDVWFDGTLLQIRP